MSSHGLSQRQIQTLRLSPQQILYTKLLQLPVLQLEQRVKQEMEENPLLEEGQENLAEEQDLDELLSNEMLPEPDSLHDALKDAATESTLAEKSVADTQATEKKIEEEKAADRKSVV